ncbi:MAG: hypothetical protein OXU68_04680 [Bacteroidota bacterium]|nr:hypothetical protein [Bacteroidota bacterium]
MRSRIGLLILAGLCCRGPSSHGQILQRGQHGFAASYVVVDFNFAGDETPLGRYDYQGPAYGLSYTTANLRGLVAYGRKGNGHTLVDVSVSGWTVLDFSSSAVAATKLGVPVGILVGWRRVTTTPGLEPYGVSSLAAGAGGLLEREFSAVSRLTLRASPFVGITGSALTDQVGLSWMAEADAHLEFDEALGGTGLIVGYMLRYQVWNVNGSGPFSHAVDENLDYNGVMHVIRAGIRF